MMFRQKSSKIASNEESYTLISKPLFIETEKTMSINDVNRIAFGATFKGTLSTANDVRIDGNFDGILYSSGRVVVGENATVKGSVYCNNIDFSGKMNGGSIFVRDTLSLKAGCFVESDLSFSKLQVEIDAKFTGKCQMMDAKEFDKISSQYAIHPVEKEIVEVLPVKPVTEDKAL